MICGVLFCSVRFGSVRFGSVRFCSVLFCSVRSVRSYSMTFPPSDSRIDAHDMLHHYA